MPSLACFKIIENPENAILSGIIVYVYGNSKERVPFIHKGFLMHIVRKMLFSAVFSMMAVMPSVTFAKDGFTGSEFLTWKHESQLGYIETAIGMAGLIATQNDTQQSSCIDGWYYSDKPGKSKIITDFMRNNPDYHPRGVILAILQKQCGSFTYR